MISSMSICNDVNIRMKEGETPLNSRLRSHRRQNFFAQVVDLLIPVGVAEAEIVHDVIQTVLLVFLGIFYNIFGFAGQEKTADVLVSLEFTKIDPGLFAGVVTFLDQAWGVDLAQCGIEVLVDADDRNRADGAHRSPLRLVLIT